MKRLLLVVVCALLCISGMARSKIGVAGGFTSSQLSLKEVDVSSATGYFAGMTFRNDLALGFVIQPGVSYNKKKSDGGADVSVSYVEIPMQLQWGPDLILFRPYVFAEPFIGMPVGRDVQYDELSTNFSYGLGLGGGIEIRETVQLSFKYYWNFEDCGLSGYYTQAKTAVNEKSSFNGLAISIAFLF